MIKQNKYKDKLESNIEYIYSLDLHNKNDELLFITILESIDYCNKLSLFDKRNDLIFLLDKLDHVLDINLEMAINKPYLYIDNDTYSSREYFTGKLKKELINLNKNFSYRYQYDKYLKNNIDYTLNKDNVDYIIRTYKNIILNTTNENLRNKCLDMIYEIYKNNPYKDLIGTKDIELIEKEYIEDTKDLVSIILLSYNNDDYVEDSIRSIFEQNYNNIELIIADDCSKNLDIEYFKNIINKYENKNIKRIIIYKSKVNLGTVSNCNKALCLSSGNYIKFIASDDLFYDSTSICEMIQCMDNKNLDMITGECKIINTDLSEDSITTNYDYIKEAILNDNIIDNNTLHNLVLLRGAILSPVPSMFTRNVFNECGFFDERYLVIEDWPYWIKISSSRCRLGYENKIFAKYRKGFGITSTINSVFNKDLSKIIQTYYPDW